MIIEAEKTNFEQTAFVESDITTWTDTDNERVAAELESLFGSEPETPGWYRMDVLADLVEAYEAINYPFPPLHHAKDNEAKTLRGLAGVGISFESA